MSCIKLIKPQERYIRSYWETFEAIVKEGKYLASNEGFPYEDTVEFVKNSIKNGYPHLFIIDGEKDICVGWCDVTPKAEDIGYLGMGLLPEYREHGIGKITLKQIVKMSEDFGFRSIELDVLKSNTRAIHVYEKLGFTQINLVESGFFTWHNTLVKEAVIQMSLKLL